MKSSIKLHSRGDDQFVNFVLLLYCVSTGETIPKHIFKSGALSKYGTISDIFKQIHNTGVHWNYGLAKASEEIANSKNKKQREISTFLLRLSKEIRLGGNLTSFLHTQTETSLQNYTSDYYRNLESIKLIFTMFTSVMSISSFVVSASTLLNMISGTESEGMYLMTLSSIILSLAMFVVVMYVVFPRDKLVHIEDALSQKMRIYIYMSLFASITIATITFVIPEIPTLLGMSVAGSVFLLPGLKAKKIENAVKKLDEWYPSFAKDFGDVMHIISSFRGTISTLSRSDFSVITPYLKKMLVRSENRVPFNTILELFTIESRSEMIKSGNEILETSISKGSDMTKVGMSIYNTFRKIIELRKNREQTTKSFVFMTIILHIVALVVFAFISQISIIFTDIFTEVDRSHSVFTFTPLDPIIVATSLPTILIAFSLINALAIKTSEGGYYKTVFYYFAILMIVGGITLFASEYIMDNFINSQNENLSRIAEIT